jgi:hypothetical protein
MKKIRKDEPSVRVHPDDVREDGLRPGGRSGEEPGRPLRGVPDGQGDLNGADGRADGGGGLFLPDRPPEGDADGGGLRPATGFQGDIFFEAERGCRDRGGGGKSDQDGGEGQFHWK